MTASAAHNEPIEWQRRMNVIRERAEFIIRLLPRSQGMYSERHQARVVTTYARFQDTRGDVRRRSPGVLSLFAIGNWVTRTVVNGHE